MISTYLLSMTKISIIIPVYNSALFLDDCVQSLLRQTLSEFDICLIDDGSTDGSGAICDSLAEKDSRIRVIHSVNHGAAHARRLGIDQAAGEFLCFVDSDDTMPIDGLERLYKASQRNKKSDIIVGFCRERPCWGRHEISVREYRDTLIEGRHNIGTLWGKLFRRTLFDKGLPTLSPHLVMGEDMLINIYLSFATEQNVVLLSGKRVYNYIQRETSISHRFELTAVYEQDFHQERLLMMPASYHSVYMEVMIHRRLRMLRRLLRTAEKKGSVIQLQQSDFVRDLLRDINQYHYPWWKYPRLTIWRLLRRASLTVS